MKGFVLRFPVVVVVVFAVLGGGIGFFAGSAGGSKYESSAIIVFTAVQIDDRPATASEARHITERVPSWAQIASSGAVARQYGLGPGEAIDAHEIAGSQSLLITLSSPRPARMAERATDAAKVVIEAVQTAETLVGAGTSRVSGMISEAGRDPVNASREWGMLGLGLGLALGTLVGWLGCVLVRPRKWVEQIPGDADRAVSAAIFADEVDRELKGIYRGLKTKRGLIVLATLFVGIAGYAGTGSPYPVLLATLVAGAASIKDPRWIAVAVLILGATVLEPKLDLVKIGPVTPTVLEVAVVIGLVLVWKRNGKSVLTWPIILATAAVLFGCARGLLLGGAVIL